MFWPQLLGIDVRPARLIRALQRSYAVPGREQFTAALDLAQTTVSSFEINFHDHPSYIVQKYYANIKLKKLLILLLKMVAMLS